ncbi:MAG: putative lipopolysaccharide heptosyltransferase III [candidate division NC10 bacterium]|nr:putative lipopolysaccharide heptosyltransferase III [candidate division NC10 bacterium]
MKLEGIGKILIIRLRNIGDVVSITPCTRAVKETFPDVHLSVLVEKASEGVLVGNPFVDEIIVLDKKGIGRPRGIRAFWRELEFLLDLRARAFDLVINLHGGPRSAIQTLFTGARHRLGGFPFWHPWNWVYNIRVRPLEEVAGREARHYRIVQRHLVTLKHAGIETADPSLVMVVTEEARVSLERLLRERGIGEGRPIVTIHPATSGKLQRWREERFAQLADRLIETFGVAVILTSGPREKETPKRVQERMRREATNLGGLLTIQELAALLEQSVLFIGLDGAPVHIASALGTPLVAIFGPTSDTWRPWTKALHAVVRSDPPCLGCKKVCPDGFPRCMDQISVGQVFKAVLAMDHLFRRDQP